MDYTREPIIETVITPKEGCKLVVRSSKSTGQEEYFVDAVEVICFGNSSFFRSTERPKAFLVPASDYEVLEVREARMVLKNVGIDRTIKIAGGREAQMRQPREREREPERSQDAETTEQASSDSSPQTSSADKPSDGRTDKKRDRRRQNRRRRGRDGSGGDDESSEGERSQSSETSQGDDASNPTQQGIVTPTVTSLLPPPPTLISETIARYKDNALFKDAFYTKEEKPTHENSETTPVIAIPQPEYGTFEMSEADEEAIYQQRQKQAPTPTETDHNHDTTEEHKDT